MCKNWPWWWHLHYVMVLRQNEMTFLSRQICNDLNSSKIKTDFLTNPLSVFAWFSRTNVITWEKSIFLKFNIVRTGIILSNGHTIERLWLHCLSRALLLYDCSKTFLHYILGYFGNTRETTMEEPTWRNTLRFFSYDEVFSLDQIEFP